MTFPPIPTGPADGFVPTRECPHRTCRPLRRALLPLAVLGPLALVFHGIASVLYILLITVIGAAVTRILTPTPGTQTTPAARPAGEPVLVARRGWGALAAATDIVYLLAGVAAVADLTTNQTSVVPTVSATSYIGLAITIVAMVVMHTVSHVAYKHAVRPAEPVQD